MCDIAQQHKFYQLKGIEIACPLCHISKIKITRHNFKRVECISCHSYISRDKVMEMLTAEQRARI